MKEEMKEGQKRSKKEGEEVRSRGNHKGTEKEQGNSTMRLLVIKKNNRIPL